jgi:hypothetical protein
MESWRALARAEESWRALAHAEESWRALARAEESADSSLSVTERKLLVISTVYLDTDSLYCIGLKRWKYS